MDLLHRIQWRAADADHRPVRLFGRGVELRYRVRQSEGVQRWYELDLLNGEEPDVMSLQADLRAAYAR